MTAGGMRDIFFCHIIAIKMPCSFKLPLIYTRVNNPIKKHFGLPKGEKLHGSWNGADLKEEEMGREESVADDYDKSHYIHVYKYHDETCYCI